MSVCDRRGELSSIELKLRPESTFWSSESESIHGISRFEADKFMPQAEGSKLLLDFMAPHKNAAIVCHAAYMFNSYFDINFLNAYLNKTFRHSALYERTLVRTSTITWFRWLDRIGMEKNDDFSLSALAKKYGIKLNHHDATSDRLACQMLFFLAMDLTKQAKGLYEFEPNGWESFICADST